jgi:thioredoxin reductase (NADPH)
MSLVRPVASLSRDPSLAAERDLVLAFCADWCGTCRAFRPVLERVAAAWPRVEFAWLDIEDDAELAGELEVESFPAVAIFRAGVPFYFGTTVPLEDVVVRLIRSAFEGDAALVAVPTEVALLGAALRPRC